MKYNIKKQIIYNYFINIIKYGSIKVNYYKAKHFKNKIFKLLNIFFKNKIIFFFLKIKIRKNDCSLIGKIGFFKKKYLNYLL